MTLAFAMDLVQWPAMLVSLWAAWLVASKSRSRRLAGFWTFIASNALWVAWGLHSNGYALIALQVGLLLMNVRGVRDNGSSADKSRN